MSKTSSTICKAKDPSTCRIHGKFTVTFNNWVGEQKFEPKISFNHTVTSFQNADIESIGFKKSPTAYQFRFIKNSSGDYQSDDLEISYRLEGTNRQELLQSLDIELRVAQEAMNDPSYSDEDTKRLDLTVNHLITLRDTLKSSDGFRTLKKRTNAYTRVSNWMQNPDSTNYAWDGSSGSIQKINRYGKAVEKEYSKLSEPEKAIVLAQSLIKYEPVLHQQYYQWGTPAFTDYAEDAWKIYKKTFTEFKHL